jgi:hypothetical protein
MPKESNSELYSLLKASEGGFSQKIAIFWLKDAGIKAVRDYSPYVGHYGLRVFGDKRKQKKASKILFRK